MAGSDLRWLCYWILCFLISSQFQGFSSSSSLPQHDFQIFRVSKPKEEDIHEIHCSRERSRAAWKIVQEYLMPFVEKERYHLPRKCRLHRDNDIYREQEEHKEHIDINEWQCGFCKKTFYEEKYLDKHFDNRHHHLLNMSHSRCLADLCGALHCDLVMDSMKRKSKCNPAAAARNQHLCESLADGCFPVNMGPSASRLHEDKCVLHHCLHYHFAVPTSLLQLCLLVPQRIENWISRTETHLSQWFEEKAFLKQLEALLQWQNIVLAAAEIFNWKQCKEKQLSLYFSHCYTANPSSS